MLRCVSLMLLSLLLCSSLCAETRKTHKSSASVPVHLSARNFLDEIVNDQWLVMFFDKDCSASKKLLPIFEQVSQEVFGDAFGGQIDCSDKTNHQICHLFDVSAYPQIRLTRDGLYWKFEGGHDSQSMTWFVDMADTLSKNKAFKFLECDDSKRSCQLRSYPKAQNTGQYLVYIYAALVALLSFGSIKIFRSRKNQLHSGSQKIETRNLLDHTHSRTSDGAQLETEYSN